MIPFPLTPVSSFCVPSTGIELKTIPGKLPFSVDSSISPASAVLSSERIPIKKRTLSPSLSIINATALFKLCKAEYTLISLSVNFSFSSKTSFVISTTLNFDISKTPLAAGIIGAAEKFSKYFRFKYISATLNPCASCNSLLTRSLDFFHESSYCEYLPCCAIVIFPFCC